MTYVYQHRRLDKDEIFYVGIGDSKKRSISTMSRNPYWRNIVRKTPVIVEIITSFNKREDACLLEKELIKKYGRKSDKGTLCNMTEGGDGGLVHKLCKSVDCFNKDGDYVASYNNIRLAGRLNNIDQSNIVKTCLGKTKTAGGYIWKYK